MSAFVIEFADHGIEQAGGIAERLEPVLAGDGGKISGGGGLHGGGEGEVFRAWVRESEVLAMGHEQANGLRG
jgi:hypothetical protein